MKESTITVFAPATVSNVGCGFDVLGFALEAPGDEVSVRWLGTSVTIDDIAGDGGRLPRDAAKNTAGIAASAVAAVVAVDALLGARTPLDTLLGCAFEGERDGAGSAHADNIAPCLYGGFVLVRQADPPDIVRLPVPDGLTAVVVHPDLEIETARARTLLGTSVPLDDAIRQWANLGALVDALHRADFAQLARSLEDAIAEPRRAPLVPGLAAIKQAAAAAGALGCGLSGSGPSLFALCRGTDAAARVAAAMTAAVTHHIGGALQTYVSPIAPRGARVVAAACAS
jgi:homoserine kinase